MGVNSVEAIGFWSKEVALVRFQAQPSGLGFIFCTFFLIYHQKFPEMRIFTGEGYFMT